MHRKIEEEPILIGHLVRSSETVLENEPEFLSISENLRHKEIIREKKKSNRVQNCSACMELVPLFKFRYNLC